MRRPIGPNAEYSFPSRLFPSSSIPSYNDRKIILNLLVTFHIKKPTRMAAYISAKKMRDDWKATRNDSMIFVLDSTSHQINKIFSSILGSIFNNAVSNAFAEYIHSSAQTAETTSSSSSSTSASSYVNTLLNSRYTLCPLGHNPEQYRIWEALLSGSIPIVEDIDWYNNVYFHPSFNYDGEHDENNHDNAIWRCTQRDDHRLLREWNAPVIWIQSWKDLPHIISKMEENNGKLGRMYHEKIKIWVRNILVTRLRETLDKGMREMKGCKI
jgi:hypothetical protein